MRIFHEAALRIMAGNGACLPSPARPPRRALRSRPRHPARHPSFELGGRSQALRRTPRLMRRWPRTPSWTPSYAMRPMVRPLHRLSEAQLGALLERFSVKVEGCIARP
ncbi:hypothetical protein ACRAWF_40125 [Streptomyces sp. L7]